MIDLYAVQQDAMNIRYLKLNDLTAQKLNHKFCYHGDSKVQEKKDTVGYQYLIPYTGIRTGIGSNVDSTQPLCLNTLPMYPY